MSAKAIDDKSIFNVARRIESVEARDAYLEQVCAGDQDQLNRVRAVLSGFEQESQFLESPAVEFDRTFLQSHLPEPTGSQIGPYKIREQLGEGGFGVVYVAEQIEPVRRKVALKIIKPGMDTKEVIARFEAERQALALMAHPNIAKVLDAGTTEGGRPYFVMELVSGIPITEFCDQQKFSTRERLELFVTVCEAVQHAHMKGIIHRDLKPTNVMVELHDVKAVPKVIDFGIAKATNQQLAQQTVYTQFSQLIGTPLYMSPEQAQLSGLDIDTRSDVYSLGVLLYELLTGATPFDGDLLSQVGLDEMRRIIREDDPPKPSTRVSTLGAEIASTISDRRQIACHQLSLLMQRELDWIVMKSLEKDRTRRYESARDLALDIQRYLDDEPVEACPPTVGYRLRKYARRHRAVLTTTILVALSMILGTGISIWQMMDAEDARDLASQRLVDERVARAEAARSAAEADRQRYVARANLYLAEMRLGWQDWNAGNSARLRETLARHVPDGNDHDHRSWEWHYLNALTERHSFEIEAHIGSVRTLEMNGKQSRLASGGDDGYLRIWDASTGSLIGSRETGHGSVRSLSWRPDGQRIATLGRDEGLRIWDSVSLELLSSVPLETGSNSSQRTVEWSPDGTRLAVGVARCPVRILDAETGELIRELSHDFRSQRFPSGYVVMDVAWHPDSTELAVGYERDVVIWDALNGSATQTLSFNMESEVFTLDWSSDGDRLAAAVYGRILRVFATHTWEVVAEWRPKSAVEAVRWHANGHWLAAATRSQRVRVWDANTAEEVHTVHGHTDWVNAVDWCQDGTGLVSGSRDGRIRRCDLELQQSSLSIPDVERIAWSRSGTRFATLTEGRVDVWDVSNSLPFDSIPGILGAWSPDSQRLAVLHDGDSVSIWDVNRGVAISTFRVKYTEKPTVVRWTLDGRHLMVKTGKSFAVISTETGEVKADVYADQRSVWWIALSGEGNNVAAVGWDRDVKVWSLASLDRGPRIYEWPGYTNWTATVAFSPDGNQVVAGGWDQVPRVWNVATGKERLTLTGHSGAIYSVCWSPDGKRIGSSGFDGDVKLWDAETGREVLTLSPFQSHCHRTGWSPDGLWLWATDHSELKLWSASPHTDHIRNLIALQKVRAERERANDRVRSGGESASLQNNSANQQHSVTD